MNHIAIWMVQSNMMFNISLVLTKLGEDAIFHIQQHKERSTKFAITYVYSVFNRKKYQLNLKCQQLLKQKSIWREEFNSLISRF